MTMTEATHKRINLAYLVLLALLVAGGTFEGLLKLMPGPASIPPIAVAAPALPERAAIPSGDSISQTAAAPEAAPEAREAPIRVPIISTVPMETVHVASPRFRTLPHHSKLRGLHKSDLHSESLGRSPEVASLDLRLVPEAIVRPQTEEHQVSTYVLMKKAK